MGLLVGAELVGLYLTEPILQNGAVLRHEIYVGWGICNNMGLLIAMAIPFAFYFIFRGEHPLLYNFVALLFCGLALLSTSRGALVGAAAAYVLCLFIVLFLGKDAKAKRVCLITLVLLCGVGLAVLALFPDMLRSMFTRGASGTRERLYEYGMRVFARSPLFGEGFFSLNRNAAYFSIWEKVGDFSDSFPERWHNTLVQLFACCGMAGFLAYVYHRYQTLQLFLRRINTEKIFIGISLLVMLVLGLVDCHFFNIGPVLVYSLALAFVEYKEA
jgi:O-antigen ligase